MATKREEAQKRRAEDRQKRRANAPKASEEPKQEETSGEEPLDTVKHAAKVAAAAAAVGAAMGAARAMTGGGEDGDEPERAPEPESEQEQKPEPEPKPEQPEQSEEPEPRAEHPRAEQEEPREERSGANPSEARRVVDAAREQLAALVGKDADSVSGLDRNGDGWLVTLEVVEVARIPESTDVLASYEVELDGDRNLVRYSRRRRYHRSQADDGELS